MKVKGIESLTEKIRGNKQGVFLFSGNRSSGVQKSACPRKTIILIMFLTF